MEQYVEVETFYVPAHSSAVWKRRECCLLHCVLKGQHLNGWEVCNRLLVFCTLPHGRCGLVHSWTSYHSPSTHHHFSLIHIRPFNFSQTERYNLSYNRPLTRSLHAVCNQPLLDGTRDGWRKEGRVEEMMMIGNNKDTEGGKSKGGVLYCSNWNLCREILD